MARACPAQIGTIIAAAVLLAPALTGFSRAAGQNAAPATAALLAGRTLSAVIYVRRPPSEPGPSELARFMFQAYLRAGGSAWVRVWDTARNAYTRPSERPWSVVGSRFCLGLPAPAPSRICANLHLWGPRIAGLGVKPYVMLDGDLKSGDAIASR